MRKIQILDSNRSTLSEKEINQFKSETFSFGDLLSNAHPILKPTKHGSVEAKNSASFTSTIRSSRKVEQEDEFNQQKPDGDERSGKMKTPKILCAALKLTAKDNNSEIILPCYRHHIGFEILRKLNVDINQYEVMQGFLADNGLCYGREIAFEYATSSKQVIPEECIVVGTLFSEDLY